LLFLSVIPSFSTPEWTKTLISNARPGDAGACDDALALWSPLAYLVADPYDPSPAELKARFTAYQAYMQSAAERKRIPPRAFEFALAP